MPVVTIKKSMLLSQIKKKLDDEKFSSILFDFGLELEDFDEENYKIEIPANRADLLCCNGIVSALNSFIGFHEIRNINPTPMDNVTNEIESKRNLIEPDSENLKKYILPLQLMDTNKRDVVLQQNTTIRPFIACAIIRNVNFTQELYDSFIDYQDKLNISLGRDRLILAIGTHDLSKISFPVQYIKVNPKECSFVALNQKEKLNLEQIVDLYVNDSKMKKYAKILKNLSEYPVFMGNDGNILSLPPLINSELTKITLDTKDIFIEITGTDFHKVNNALKVIVNNFGTGVYNKIPIILKDQTNNEVVNDIVNLVNQYAETEEVMKLQIQNCNIKKESNSILPESSSHEESSDTSSINSGFKTSVLEYSIIESIKRKELKGKKYIELLTPLLHERIFVFELNEINKELGLRLTIETLMEYLRRMMYMVFTLNERIIVKVPDVRIDVLHKVDIFEDICIAHGYNKFQQINPKFYTIAQEDSNNKFCNILRREIIESGYNELLTLSLLSKKEELEFLEKVNHTSISNPKSNECEIVRSSLLPGILKSIHCNQHNKVPIMVFEVSDVVKNGINHKHLCAAYAGKTDGFENIIGLLSLIMKKIGLNDKYEYQESTEATIYFKGRDGNVMVNNEILGKVGVIKPEICIDFKIPLAISSFEIDLTKLLKVIKENNSK